jgi:hypothetical protein
MLRQVAASHAYSTGESTAFFILCLVNVIKGGK